MIKKLLSLLAASTSFLTAILVANVAIASPQTESFTSNINQTASVNLNVISPSLEFVNQSDRLLLAHSGCSCAACTQGINQTI